MKSRVAVIWVLGLWGCGAPTEVEIGGEALGVEASALGNKDFDVDFSGCAEFAGIGFVPAANARPLVPAHYTLAGTADSAMMVIRVARCSSSIIDGKDAGATTTSQIGISVTGQDATAHINNYTLFYATDQPRLHARIEAAGLASDNTNGLSIALSGSALSVASSSQHGPTFSVTGNVPGPFFPPDVFIASWWGDGNHGVFRARTVFPAIQFSLSTVTLTTPAGSALANLIGGTTYTFQVLDSYNTFTSSHLEVRDTD